VHQASAFVQELQAFGDLKQSLLDLELVNLKFSPPLLSVCLFYDIATPSPTDTAGLFLFIFFL
jgi:hypothetical protein